MELQLKKYLEKLSCIFLIVIIISCCKVCAQTEEIHFSRLSTRSGFSSNEINNILRDSRGFIWFATPMGLHRWDGYEMKVFYNDPDCTNTLSASSICCVYEDEDSTIWIGTFNSGLNKYNCNLENFCRYDIGNVNPEENNQNIIWGIYKDFNKNLWLATEYGLIKFNHTTGKFKRFVTDPESGTSPSNQARNYFRVLFKKDDKTLLLGSRNGLVQFDINKEIFIPLTFSGYLDNIHNIRGISGEGAGIFWIVSYENGLYRYDYSTGRIKKFIPRISNKENGLFDRLTSICVKSPDEIWIGSDIGLFKFNQRTNTAIVFQPNSRDITSISSSMIRTIYLDNDKNLWIGTMDRGVNFLSNTQKPYKLYKWDSENANSLGRGFVTSICEDNFGNIWAGSWGGGLSCFLQKNKSYIHFTSSLQGANHIPVDYINVIHCDTNNNIWIGATGLNILNPLNGTIRLIDELKHRGIRSICNGTDGDIWIGFKYSGFVRYNQIKNSFKYFVHAVSDSTSLSNDHVLSMHFCKSGTLWIGTNDGLNRLNDFLTEKPAITRYYNNPDDINSVSDNHITSIYEDSKERVWIGTEGGLNQYNPEIDGFRRVSVTEGLANNTVQNITEDNKGNLWIRWGEKLIKYNPDTGDSRIYDERDEFLPEGEYGGWNAVLYKGKSGEMYYGGVDEFISFDPDELNDNPLPPPIVITNFLLNNRPVNIGKNLPLKKSITETKLLELTHTQNIISFEFAALDYTNPLKNQYSYKMEGVDKDWIYTDANRRYATYTNLNPGEYIFKVKGSNNDGTWNEQGASVKIIILPPWWRTMWAYAAYTLILIAAIYLTWRLQLKKMKIKQEFEMSKFEAEKMHEVDTLKTRFFTNISHEFRTPLTLIMGPSRQIIEMTDNDTIIENAKLINRSAKKLNRLAGQLLDIARIEAGHMKLRVTKQNIVSLICESVSAFLSFADRKKISLKFYSDPEDIKLYTDKDKIDKIMGNLLSNAVKFTPEGGSINVEVKRYIPRSFTEASSRTPEKTKEFIEISVSDTGIGIPREQLDKIFDRFYQVDNKASKKFEGTGVGLSLTKELVELHKGRIMVVSEEGKGSTFKVLLPVGKEQFSPDELSADKIEETEILKTEFPLSPALLQPAMNNKQNGEELIKTDNMPSILIIEDNSELRYYIKEILSESYYITEASDGEEGLKNSSYQMPDLIICDIMMPGMDGIQVCTRLRSNTETSHIPLIFLTARATLKDKIEGLETGADDYIMKPFEADELKVRIRNLLDRRARLHEYFKKHGLFELDEKQVTPVDKQFLQNVMNVINEHISDPSFSTEIFADSLAISRSLLNKKLTALIGEPPGEFIRRLRLNKAAEMIKNNSGNFTEIAFGVGFNDPSYFSVCFKKQFGMSPSQYHKSFVKT